MTTYLNQLPALDASDMWADYWFYQKGLNVMPQPTKSRDPSKFNEWRHGKSLNAHCAFEEQKEIDAATILLPENEIVLYDTYVGRKRKKQSHSRKEKAV